MFLRRVFLIFLILALPALAQRWSDDSLERLQMSPVKDWVFLNEALEDWEGSNPYLLVTLENGDQAVFRSEDDPWGSMAEVSGYEIDSFLETELVPPTVKRIMKRSQWPGKWPWKETTRPGSLQLFVEGAEPTILESLSQEDRANCEILGFLTGRYDNHSGNLLRDKQGRAVMIDFEGSLDIQKVRYGEFPFIRRGGPHHTPEVVSGDKPFPFDSPKELTNPNLAQIQETFDPWWGQIWPQGMKQLARLVRRLPDQKVPYILWDDFLWIGIEVRSRHAYHTDHYPKKTMQRINAIDESKARSFLPSPYRKPHLREFMNRRAQLLEAAQESGNS